MKIKNKILTIEVENESIILRLRSVDSESIISQQEWQNDNSSSEQLLDRIDMFLEDNEIKIVELYKVETKIDENQKYTLARIIKTVANTINYCLEVIN